MYHHRQRGNDVQLKQRAETNLALGSDVTLTVVSTAEEQQVTELFQSLWRDIYVFERRFSRFLPMSELSVFNRSAGMQMAVTPEFRNMLLAAKQLGEQTEGLFSPFILPALQKAGYTRSFVEHYKNDRHDDYSDRQVARVRDLKINQITAAIPPNSALDFGGCGKGYLADQLARAMPDWVQGFWISLGGDIVAAGHDVAGQPFKVDIQSAANLAKLSPWSVKGSRRQFAVATSGTGVRHGIKKGSKWHHIIDPRTLKPSETDVQLATVYAPVALQVDVLASCAVLLGSEKAVPYLRQHGVKAALLQCVDADGQRFETRFGPAIQASHQLEAKAHA
ncbi:hypothetical protein COY17_01905 [Candidatus Saccharibacteria bacterium CG_4_10_14_0_2_um_filter_52_9]|nr:MAG: hypothetical protein COY17_01905 [Candidatus Saccharibacteria bacterium CG_4_10_14_0_2_um_filter_52_9]